MTSRTGSSAVATISLGAIIVSLAAWYSNAQAAGPDKASIERGRYIAKIAGCNDCHTPNYPMSGGTVPERDWLVGDHLGWKGAWGTTYPANLRLLLANMSENDWVKFAHTVQTRPPMPWFALRDMSEQDLRAFHRFVRSLGSAGEPAPAYVPPTQQPNGPVVTFPAPPAPPQKAAIR